MMTVKPMLQRDMVRNILDQVGYNQAAARPLYAQAERDGRVMRIRNASRLSPEEYFDWLWHDGHRRDRPWIIDHCRKRGIKM